MPRKGSDTPMPHTPSRRKSSSNFQPLAGTSQLVVGIDFGTTFTGVAYAHTNTKEMTFTSDRSTIDNIVVVKTWPSQSSHFAEKTPSVLSYSTDPPAWGGNVKNNDSLRVAHFKLGLQDNVASHYAPPSGFRASIVETGYLTDPNWKHLGLPGKTPVDFAADYLTRVVLHLTTEVLPSRYGDTFLQRQQISYVITVPAIWSDKAKELTRRAAIRAGIAEDKLTLITEPEAAALFCVTLCEEVDLKEGDRFLICDAGGGTVVCAPGLFLDLLTWTRI
jgi:molecular chaperone DnaK (HSP70)